MSGRRLAILPLMLSGMIVASSLAIGQEALTDTKLWDDRQGYDADAAAMVAGIHRLLDRDLAASVEDRAKRWAIDSSSSEAWAASVEPNRQRFRSLLGLADPRATPVAMERVGTTDVPSQIAAAEGFRVLTVRWEVFPGTFAEGLLLEPEDRPARANVVVLPDAEQTPEAVAGLDESLPAASQVARLLAEDGYRVVVPTLLDRSCAFSGNPSVRMTNLTHREWIWRQAYEAGRHPLGYEVETVSAVIDWFLSRPDRDEAPIGVAGYGEGGLVAFYAAAADPRIEACWVAGAFGHTRDVWNQPIERDVFGLLTEFGDAEIANLVMPRGLVIEACAGPQWTGPLPPVGGRSDAAPGRLEPSTLNSARSEILRHLNVELPPGRRPNYFVAQFGTVEFQGWNARDWARRKFLSSLFNRREEVEPADSVPPPVWKSIGALPQAAERMHRLVEGWTDHTQRLIRTSELRRYDAWKDADASSPEAWAASIEPYRERFWNDLLGKLPPATEPLEPRTVQILDEPNYVGYAVELPVWPDVVASGVLLLPKDLKPGERRPVVVCQHGLEGTPEPIIDRTVESVYNAYGAHLADRGYIVYAPQNPYKGHDAFRQIQRKAHPLGRSLFGIIVRQHERTLEWLKTLSNVDPDRIAFYGLSYGGKTAMRVPAVLTDYCLSICSADFNEWVVKCTNLERSYSYMYTIEYDMYEWDLASGFNYAEMAGLIAPRPFQVERGHDDGVAPDEWIGYEFAKVKRTYDRLNLGDRCDITYFNGGHQIQGEGTFRFLAEHLNWPRGAEPLEH